MKWPLISRKKHDAQVRHLEAQIKFEKMLRKSAVEDLMALEEAMKPFMMLLDPPDNLHT